MMPTVSVKKSLKKGNFWNVILNEKTDSPICVESDLPYAQAYKAKLDIEKRIAANHLPIPRRPLIMI